MIKRIILVSLLSLFSINSFSAEVNVYSARKEALIKPLLKRFTKETGIKVNLITGKDDALIKRMEVEGKHSPADILITTDAARLYRAKEKGLFQPIKSEFVTKRVPQAYRDSENQWVGLSLRSRVIVYAKARVDADELSSYEDLVDTKWKNKICIRSSSNIYNQSLMASLIHHLGKERAESWSRGLLKNFARDPEGGDRDQIRAVATGVCDIAVVNTYYLGSMHDSNLFVDQEAVEKVGLFWPNQTGRGAHINLSGVGLTGSSKNTKEAIQLIEFLLTDESQLWYAERNYEYPVVADVEQHELIDLWGTFKADTMQMELLGKYNKDAVLIMDKIGWK